MDGRYPDEESDPGEAYYEGAEVEGEVPGADLSLGG
jgi:hypothetical protein